jgi:hypothetical protein
MKVHDSMHITARLEAIQTVLEAAYDGDDGHVIMSRLTLVSAYMAESGKLLADAQYHYQARMQTEMMQLIRDLLPDYTSASAQNAFVKSLCKEELRLVQTADRVNASCTHQLDSMRSQLSYLKMLATV